MKYTQAILISTTMIFSVAAVAENKTTTKLDEISVIGTREAQSIKETALSIGVVKKQDIESIKPAHPSEIMERIPGVHVNVTGGEGHMTAIRQPITTNAVYLYLEDGIPTRSTGFFNHNALYEINVPQSDRIEVLKGPGSALYGSDAIGGVINVETKPSPLKPEADISVEVGEFGWKRLLLSGGNTIDDDGYRASLNATHTDGWRDSTEYHRQSATVRWDRMLESGASLKTVLSSSNIDQQTAGSSRLLESDYYNNPTLNYTPISYRKVSALRLSTAYEKESSDTLFSITPYARSNSMDMLPNWSLSYDPVTYETKNDSVGLLVKYRQDYKPMKTRLVTGIDVDYSPGGRVEQQISATKVGSIYTSYTTGATLYDYDATFSSLSPYAHLEFSPSDNWRVTTGLRYDYMSYNYDNKLTELTTGSHRRPADTNVDFDHLSPKLGATYQFSPKLNAFISYRQAFRAPSEGQLFRQGQAINTVNLKPIRVQSVELGLRSKSDKSHYNISLYSMTKKDDILTYRHPDNTRETMNAGETLHQGIEVGFGTKLVDSVMLDIAASYA
jgi:outer membrane receptor protein involved in Fe transport